MRMTVRRSRCSFCDRAHGITAWQVIDPHGLIHYVTWNWRSALDRAFEIARATSQPGTGVQVQAQIK